MFEKLPYPLILKGQKVKITILNDNNLEGHSSQDSIIRLKVLNKYQLLNSY